MRTSEELRPLVLQVCISPLDPLAIETMLPGLAAGGDSGVFLAADLTEGSVGTRVAICGRGDWWGRLGIALAAACKLAMVFFAMWPSTDRAESMEGVAEVGLWPQEKQWVQRGRPIFMAALLKKQSACPTLRERLIKVFIREPICESQMSK